jgi:cytochrome bd-type quinol oxidase subunit 2
MIPCTKGFSHRTKGVLGYALVLDLTRVLADPHTTRCPYLLAFPVLGAVAGKALARSVRHNRNGSPFYGGTLISAARFGTLAISFGPYIIQFAITLDQAATPLSGLALLFWRAGLFTLPLMLLQTLTSYPVVTRKVRTMIRHY